MLLTAASKKLTFQGEAFFSRTWFRFWREKIESLANTFFPSYCVLCIGDGGGERNGGMVGWVTVDEFLGHTKPTQKKENIPMDWLLNQWWLQCCESMYTVQLEKSHSACQSLAVSKIKKTKFQAHHDCCQVNLIVRRRKIVQSISLTSH